MESLYAAYGLCLASSFALPGMQPATAPCLGLPSLELTLARGADVDRAWSGADGPPVWRGRQGDGRDLVLEHGVAGDQLFTYGDLARFRLDPPMRRLECAPRESGLAWQRSLLSKVIPSISVMRGYEALHAAVVDSADGVVAIMAASGIGKSTLAGELLGRGTTFFADDQLTLGRAAGSLMGYPGTPHMNATEAGPGRADPRRFGSVIGVLDGELWLAMSRGSCEPRPLRLLCLLQRGPGLTLSLEEVDKNPVLLAPYMLGLASEPDRTRSRFSLFADLIDATPLVRLSASLADTPDRLADLLEDALVGARRLESGVLG
jgi:hypothetical protein